MKRGEKIQQFCKFCDGRVHSDLTTLDEVGGSNSPKKLLKKDSMSTSTVALGTLTDSGSPSKLRKIIEFSVYETTENDEKYNIGNIGVYEGPWVNGKKHGIGSYRMPCGSVYNGPFVNGVKHGLATIKFGNGQIFEGDVVNEKMIGKCTYKWPDQTILSPASASNPVAFSTKIFGKTYTGDYHFAKSFNGNGLLKYHESGNVLEGLFEDGYAVIEKASTIHLKETDRKYNIYFTNPSTNLPGIFVNDRSTIYDITLKTADGADRFYRSCRMQDGILLFSEEEIAFREREAIRLQIETEEKEKKRLADEEAVRLKKEEEEEAKKKAEEAEIARKRMETRLKEEEKKRLIEEQKRKRQQQEEEEARIAEEKRKKEEEEFKMERAKAKAKKEGNAAELQKAEQKLKQLEADKAALDAQEKAKAEREKKEAEARKRREQIVTVRLPNGNVYTGELDEKGIFQGKGNLLNPHKDDGFSYNGFFENGLKHGHGTLKYTSKANPFEYTGDFISGKRHGRGRMVFGSGDIFEGQFVDNQMEGSGVYTYTTFAGKFGGPISYDGQYHQDIKHGSGTLTWSNGNYFIGTFNKNIMMQGKLYVKATDTIYGVQLSGGADIHIPTRSRMYSAVLMQDSKTFKPVRFTNGTVMDPLVED